MSKLNSIVLGDFIDVITDYHANGAYEKLKENVVLKYEEDYAVMIRTLNFESNEFTNNLIYLNEIEYNYLSKTKVYPYDIIMNKIANPGSVYLMPKVNKPVSLAMNLFLIRFDDHVDQRFMFYLMKSNEKYIKRFANGTSTKTITKDSVRGLKFKIPEKNYQQKIAKVLSDLDAKIDLNNKINAELEAKAKTLYDYWFVQFDFPDVNGKPYKSSGGKIVWNEELKREIPEGWVSFKLSNQFVFEKGIEPGSAEYVKQKDSIHHVKFIRVGDINGSSSIYIDTRIKNYSLVSERDVLVTFDGSVGKTAFGLEGAYSGGYRKIYDDSGLIDSSLIYFIFKDERIIKTIHKYATGSILLHAGSSINILKIPYNEKVYIKFQKLIRQSYDKMVINKKTNQELASLRDWLLPMLMNGQVTVGEVQNEVLGMVAEPQVQYEITEKTPEWYDQRFNLWITKQVLAARGEIDRTTLRELFDAMDDEDK